MFEHINKIFLINNENRLFKNQININQSIDKYIFYLCYINYTFCTIYYNKKNFKSTRDVSPGFEVRIQLYNFLINMMCVCVCVIDKVVQIP